jgi:hypothetical protein
MRSVFSRFHTVLRHLRHLFICHRLTQRKTNKIKVNANPTIVKNVSSNNLLRQAYLFVLSLHPPFLGSASHL